PGSISLSPCARRAEPVAMSGSSNVGGFVFGFVESGEHLGDGAEPGVAQRALPARLFGQPHGHRRVDDHYRVDIAVQPSGARHVAVIYAPEDLRSAVHSLHRRPPLVALLELPSRPRERREAPEILLDLYPHAQAMLLPLVALLMALAVEAL